MSKLNPKKPKAKWLPCQVCGKVSRHNKRINGESYCNKHLPKES